ncbi:MAG: hypothetical protein OXP68_00965 [Anaerolineaceae bacterium]|nr:hypothetical protein [Anaerolineaceae bacterium]MDE0328771.1 hypothetical protein [Anaerolineaceae bacterium]
MGLGKQIRMNRIFANPSGNLCSVAIDHYIGYQAGIPAGLQNLRNTLAAVMAGPPDAVTMHKGTAAALWGPYAGAVPLILQSSFVRTDDTAIEQFVTVEEALRLGADAIAVVIYVRGDSEVKYLRILSDTVEAGARHELPVICHVYPRGANNEIVYNPEDIAWGVRCAAEVGADVVKTPWCGDTEAHTQIADRCPVPLVAAGGPQSDTLDDALAMFRDLLQAGVRGGVIGRNIWGHENVTGTLRAFRRVIHGE